MIGLIVLVSVLKTCDHTPGVALDHHTGDFGIGISVAQTDPGDHILEKPHSRLQFLQLPASLTGNGMGFAFDVVIFF